jgi:SRSO17 transposase
VLFDELMGQIAGRFARVEPRRRARAFVLGLLAELPRKNCWTIAEHAGDAGPDGMQYLLERACWDADAVRDDVRGYVVAKLADCDAMLVVDEAGDVKKGTATAGVQRQYSGTAGRVENTQVAVYLSYAGRGGHALIDREPYLPGRGSATRRRAHQHRARICHYRHQAHPRPITPLACHSGDHRADAPRGSTPAAPTRAAPKPWAARPGACLGHDNSQPSGR